jgi:hypothetical protein
LFSSTETEHRIGTHAREHKTAFVRNVFVGDGGGFRMFGFWFLVLVLVKIKKHSDTLATRHEPCPTTPVPHSAQEEQKQQENKAQKEKRSTKKNKNCDVGVCFVLYRSSVLSEGSDAPPAPPAPAPPDWP